MKICLTGLVQSLLFSDQSDQPFRFFFCLYGVITCLIEEGVAKGEAASLSVGKLASIRVKVIFLSSHRASMWDTSRTCREWSLIGNFVSRKVHILII